ncbi:hypothetical protein FRC11_012744, partial [Ceratobasidium sp. 423]
RFNSTIIAGDSQSSILSWDAHTSELSGTPLTGHSACILSIAISPDGSCFASASWDSTIRIWCSESKQTVIGPLKGHVGGTNQVVFSPNGRYIASCGDDSTICIWDAETGDMCTDIFKGHTKAVNSVQFFPDSPHLVSCSDDGTIRIWSVQGIDTNNDSTDESLGRIRAARFSSDGSQIVTGGKDGSIYLWDARSGELVVGPLTGHTREIYSVDISPDRSYIASASSDKTIRLWDINRGSGRHKVLRSYIKHADSINFSSDSTRVLFGPNGSEEQVWDVQSGQLIGDTLNDSEERVHSNGVSPYMHRRIKRNMKRIIAALLKIVKRLLRTDHLGHAQSVRTLASGSRLVFDSTRVDIRTRKLRTGYLGGNSLEGSIEDLFSIVAASDDPQKRHTEPVLIILLYPDGKRMLSCSCDHTTRLEGVPGKAELAGSHLSDTRQDNSKTPNTDTIWKLNHDGWIVNPQATSDPVWIRAERSGVVTSTERPTTSPSRPKQKESMRVGKRSLGGVVGLAGKMEKVEIDSFSGRKIYPSKGKLYVRGDSKVGHPDQFDLQLVPKQTPGLPFLDIQVVVSLLATQEPP